MRLLNALITAEIPEEIPAVSVQLFEGLNYPRMVAWAKPFLVVTYSCGLEGG